MEYEGSLYGKVGKSTFPLNNTTQDVDDIVKSAQHALFFLRDNKGYRQDRNEEIADIVQSLESSINKFK